MPFTTQTDMPIYYESKGTGPAIVFAHGAGGNAAIWYNQIAHFAADYQVVVFDHRTFGRTGVPAEPITVHHFRDDLLGLLDELDIAAAHLVGQSMGGFTALRTVLDAPERVLSLTMSATAGGIYNPDPPPSLRNIADSGDNNAEGVKATMSAKTKTNPALMQAYESINNFNVNFSWSNLASLLDRETVVQWEQLGAITTPTLFIAGAEDPLFPAEQLASYVPHFANARIEVVTDSGHSPYFEQPQVFNRLLAEHLSAVA